MKFLSWYTLIIIGLIQLYTIAGLIDGTEDTFTSLFVMVAYVPPILLAVKSLKGIKK